MAMSENSVVVLEYLKSIGDADVTAQDVADALKLSSKSVNAIFTALQRKQIGSRVEAQVQIDGKYKDVKFLKLTDLGKTYDHVAEAAKEEAEKIEKAKEKAAEKAAKAAGTVAE